MICHNQKEFIDIMFFHKNMIYTMDYKEFIDIKTNTLLYHGHFNVIRTNWRHWIIKCRPPPSWLTELYVTPFRVYKHGLIQQKELFSIRPLYLP